MKFKTKSSKALGPILIYLSLIITTILWLLVPGKLAYIQSEPIKAFNQIAALLGTVLFSWTMLLSTRANFLEDLFGGLDKVYLWHKYTGQYSGILIFMHPLLLALHKPERFVKWFIPTGRNLAVDLGVWAFWGFTYIIIITLLFRYLKLKYHHWKWLHKILDLIFFLAFIHIAFIGSDLAVFLPLKIWVKILTFVGLAAGLYKLILYQLLADHYEYEIIKIEKLDKTYNILLKPLGKKINYIPGQFSFVKFKSQNVSSEEHPFCIASAPEDKYLRYVIKELGDFTSTLYKLKPGDKAIIYAPYGRISMKYFEDPRKDAVFIAGGVGIAPFLAMSRTAPQYPNRHIYLYWCTRYAKEAVSSNELKEFEKTHLNFTYKNHKSREGDGHITAQHILADIRDPKNTIFYMCAPVPMMKDLHKQLRQAGIPEEYIVWEDFEMI